MNPAWERHAPPWGLNKTLGEILAMQATRAPAHEAVVFPQLGLRWTYEEFHRRVVETARALIALGIGGGAHVGIWSTNWPEWVLLQFATAQVGAVLVNINPAYRTHELDYILQKAEIEAIFLTDRFKGSDYEAMLCEVVPELNSRRERLASARFPRLRYAVSIKNAPSRAGIMPWDVFAEGARDVDQGPFGNAAAGVDPESCVNIQYTSGTTGFPKGAMLSHRNLILNAYHIGQGMSFTSEDRLCIPVPLYHCFGCVIGSLLCVVHGATMVFPAEHFDPEATLDAVHRERCTGLLGVPTMFNAELHSENLASYDFSTMRTGMMAGSPCPVELMKRVIQVLNMREIVIGYGQTEASPVITLTASSEPVEIRCSTVGKALPGVEVRIVDPETLQDVPVGADGELWARGPNIMIGYYNDEAATRAAITEDGWLRTGDLARQSEAGHYHITGRIKDMIIRGGENIYPREIEEFLMSHPKVRDVQVVGLPDPHYGEQICACIVREDTSLTAEEVRRFGNGLIAHYKVPHYVMFVDEFPMTVTGKIQKFRLRELGIREFGLEAHSKIETA